MKKFIETSKLMLWLICAAALLITGVSLVTPSPIASVKAAGESGVTLTYTYTGSVEEVSLPAGEYTFELWGADGGFGETYAKSYGGYSTGTIKLETSTTLYLAVGGKGNYYTYGGTNHNTVAQNTSGGFNGGGSVYNSKASHGSGGGATHIAMKTGTLSSLESFKNDVVIVAGGAGGSGNWQNASHHGGGITGAGTRPGTQTSGGVSGGTNCTAGSFGQGGNGYGNSGGGSGGGGGWYGGGSGYGGSAGGGGGSGYIDDDLTLGATVQYGQVGYVDHPLGVSTTPRDGYIRIYKEWITYTFNVDGQEFYSHTEELEETLVDMPSNIPAKVGYIFTGWKNQTVDEGAKLYHPDGPNNKYTNTTSGDITFEAVFTEAIYDIEFFGRTTEQLVRDDLGVPYGDINQSIYINEEGLGLYINTDTTAWDSENYRWAILSAGTDGTQSQHWSNFSNQAEPELDVLTGTYEQSVEFIQRYVEFYNEGESPAPNHVGKITFRKVDIAQARNVNIISNMNEAGSLSLVVLEEGKTESPSVTENFGGVVTLPSRGWVQSISVNVKPHYTFVKFEVLDGNEEPIETIHTKEYNSSSNENFKLTETVGVGLKSGYSIMVYYEKVEYNFVFDSALKGQEGTSLGLIANESREAISIGEATSFNAVALSQSIDQRYKFVSWKIYNHFEQKFEYYEKGMLEYDFYNSNVDLVWLNKYLSLSDGIVTVFAEYTMAYQVRVNIAENQENYGYIDVTVYDALLDDYINVTLNELDMYLIGGSSITIMATPYTFYELDKYAYTNGGLVSNNMYIEMQVSDDCEIIAIFRAIEYSVVFEAKDSIKDRKIENSTDKYYIERNNSDAHDDKISIDDLLNLIATEKALDGYRFDGYEIRNADGEKILNPNNIIITEEILLNNFNTKEGKEEFVITVYYTKINSLKLDIIGLGSALVYEETTPGSGIFKTEATSQRDFIIGTKLKIKAVPSDNNYFDIDRFENLSIGYVPEKDDEVIITLDHPRSLILYFKTIPFTIDADLNKVDITTTTGLHVGDSIVLTANPGSGKELKKWTINDIAVKDLAKNSAYDITVSDNAVTIKLTTNWLNDFGREINSEAKFGMPSATETIILITAIAVPLLLAIFLFYFINLRRKTALIKKELQEEFKAKQKFGTSSLLKDLREGKEIGVTDEAVKKAMKEKKKKPESK